MTKTRAPTDHDLRQLILKTPDRDVITLADDILAFCQRMRARGHQAN